MPKKKVSPERDALNQIEDVLVNQYGLENEPLTAQELRDICDFINAIVKKARKN